MAMTATMDDGGIGLDDAAADDDGDPRTTMVATATEDKADAGSDKRESGSNVRPSQIVRPFVSY